MDKLIKAYKEKRKFKGFSMGEFHGIISRVSVSKFESGGDIKLSNFVRMLDRMDYELIIIDKR